MSRMKGEWKEEEEERQEVGVKEEGEAGERKGDRNVGKPKRGAPVVSRALSIALQDAAMTVGSHSRDFPQLES